VHGITGLVNKIHFNNAEEEGMGQALICTPHFNQFFFMLVIASTEHWLDQGQEIFSAIKSHIHFHPQFKPAAINTENDKYPDLTIEAFESIMPEENLIVSIVRGDISLLMAAHTAIIQDEITLTGIVAPGDQTLYHYDLESGDLSSQVSDQPIISEHGEICLLLPFANQQALQIGNYRFTFATQRGLPLQDVQVIIRHGRALELQKIDLNLWLALEDEVFNNPDFLAEFETNLRSALAEKMAPMNLAPGKLACYHPAPDELASFATINLDTDLADCSYMIAESVENGRALYIGLVDRFTRGDPPMDSDTPAVSCGSPGMILSPVSPHACILVNYAVLHGNYSALATAIIEQLVYFCGAHPPNTPPDQPLAINPDLIWRLRKHPLFYDAD
jgi:hypothetical protein